MENTTLNQKSLNNSDAIDFRELFAKYFQKWLWFVISLGLFTFLALIYLKSQNKAYEVKTTILLRKDPSSSNFSEMALLEGLGMSGSSKEVEDEIQLLQSKSIMRTVIQTLRIETEYYKKNGIRYEELYTTSPISLITPAYFNDTVQAPVFFWVKLSEGKYTVEISHKKSSETYTINDIEHAFKTSAGTFKFDIITSLEPDVTYKIISHPIKSLTEFYTKEINISAVNKKSSAISLMMKSTCPKKTQVLLNKLVELYNLDAIIDKNMLASNTATFVDERLKIISSELLDVELSVENYKKTNQLTDISSEAELLIKSSADYNNKLAEIETQLNLIEYIETYVKDDNNQYNYVPANLGVSDGKAQVGTASKYRTVPSNLGIEDKSLLMAIQEYNKALLERMKVLRTTNDRNPVVVQMEEQLKSMRASIVESIQSIKQGVEISKKRVIGKGEQFIGKIKNIPTQERQFLEIKRQQEIKQNLYLFLLKKREENALSLASTIPSAKTIDAAYVSVQPVAPKSLIVLAIGLMFGLIFPIILLYILELFNNKISDKKDLQKFIDVPFLGSIGVNKGLERIVVGEGVTTPVVEMFKLIRTNLQFMLGGKKSPVLLVTSSVSGEGKSFTSINIAMSFALLKKKVVLVGLDVRNPMLGEYLHIPKSSGVTLYLSDPNYSLKDIIVPSGFHTSLSIIPAGPVPPNPAELLMSHRLDELIEELKKDFDYIIIDSAPVGLVSDTFLLNRFVDNSLYVVRQDYTPREMTQLINDLHKTNKLNNMAVVLNGTNETDGYGYGYAQKKTKQKGFNFKSILSIFIS